MIELTRDWSDVISEKPFLSLSLNRPLHKLPIRASPDSPTHHPPTYPPPTHHSPTCPSQKRANRVQSPPRCRARAAPVDGSTANGLDCQHVHGTTRIRRISSLRSFGGLAR